MRGGRSPGLLLAASLALLLGGQLVVMKGEGWDERDGVLSYPNPVGMGHFSVCEAPYPIDLDELVAEASAPRRCLRGGTDRSRAQASASAGSASTQSHATDSAVVKALHNDELP